jgi:hypothetical protein
MQSESDPKPFYVRRNIDGSRDEYVLLDGWSEVLHRHVTPRAHRWNADLVRNGRPTNSKAMTASSPARVAAPSAQARGAPATFPLRRALPFGALGKLFRECGK